MNAKKIDESGQFEFWIEERNILIIRLVDKDGGKEIGPEDARHSLMVQERLYKEQGQKLLILGNLGELSKINKAAREFAKSNEGQAINQYTLAYALIASNRLNRMMGNMFGRIFRRSYPIKMFTSEEKAINWLLEQRNDQEAST
ncbi:STAS/SEC14 domain-containing protein [Saprospira grandis]|nr:STAS/SEC14 domain-containing protein [Saprospira grandis]